MKPGLTARVGAALLAPGAAARRLCAAGSGSPRGGLADVLWLLPARVMVADWHGLVARAQQARDEGPGYLPRALLDLVIRACSLVLPDVLLIFVSGVVLGLLLGEKERRMRPGLSLDLAGMAWLSWFAVHVVAVLALTLLQHEPGEGLRRAIQIAALGLFCLSWLTALRQARRWDNQDVSSYE